MKKLNTHLIYDLAVRVHPLTEINYPEGTTLGEIFWKLAIAKVSLQWFMGSGSFFSASLKRAASSLVDTIHGMGVPVVLPWEGESAQPYDPQARVESWQLSNLGESAKGFETVLGNELPGLAIYYVLQKGIYSTDDLLTRADHHVPESIRAALPEKASQDIRESGRCLAFELATASAFHMWRALETVIEAYYEELTGNTFDKDGVSRNWGAYIKALDSRGADKKITLFLDHIREEYRNPVNHPTVTLEPEDAFNLFSAGLSAICQSIKATINIREANKVKAGADAALPMARAAGALPGGAGI